MKVRLPKTLSPKFVEAVHEEVAKEYQKMYMKHQEEIQHDIAVQLTSVVLYTLDLNYGFKKRRLKVFVSEVNENFKMLNRGYLGKKLNTNDTISYIKDKYGIDLDKEISVISEEDNGR